MNGWVSLGDWKADAAFLLVMFSDVMFSDC